MLSCFKSSSSTRTVTSLRQEVMANRYRASRIINVEQSDETIRTGKINELLPKLESTCETLTFQVNLREKQITNRSKSYMCGCLKKYMNKKTERKITAINKLQEKAQESIEAIQLFKSNGTAAPLPKIPQLQPPRGRVQPVLPSNNPEQQVLPSNNPVHPISPSSDLLPQPIQELQPALPPSVIIPPTIVEEDELPINAPEQIRIKDAHKSLPNMCGDFCLHFLKDYFYPNAAVRNMDSGEYTNFNPLDFNRGMACSPTLGKECFIPFTQGGTREEFTTWLKTLDKNVPYIIRTGPLHGGETGHYLTMYNKEDQWCCVSNTSPLVPLTFADGSITQEAIDTLNIEANQWSNCEVRANATGNLAIFAYPMTEQHYHHLSNYSHTVRTQGEKVANARYPLSFSNTHEKYEKGTPEKLLFHLGSMVGIQVDFDIPSAESKPVDIVTAADILCDFTMVHSKTPTEMMEDINALDKYATYLITFTDDSSANNHGILYNQNNQWFFMDNFFQLTALDESDLKGPPFSDNTVLKQFKIAQVTNSTISFLSEYVTLARQVGHSTAIATIIDQQEAYSKLLSPPTNTPIFNTPEIFGEFQNVCSERCLIHVAKLYGFPPPEFHPDTYSNKNLACDVQIDLMAPLSLIGHFSEIFHEGNNLKALTKFIADLDINQCYIMRTGANNRAGHHFTLYFSPEHQVWYSYDSPTLPCYKMLDKGVLTQSAKERFYMPKAKWGYGDGEYVLSATPIPKDQGLFQKLAAYLSYYRSTGSELGARDMWAKINGIQSVPTNFES